MIANQQNWSELRMHGNMPERRSYHSSFIFEDKMYIYGGLDIQNGSVDSLWELDLTQLQDLEAEEIENRHSCMWRQISQQGKKENCPGPVAYHTSVVYKEQMFLFGGNNYAKTVQTYSNDEKNFTPLYSLNMKNFSWY